MLYKLSLPCVEDFGPFGDYKAIVYKEGLFIAKETNTYMTELFLIQ
jgi:hypothetical protein